MRAVILCFIIKDYLSHAQVDKIKNSQWVLAGLPTLNRLADSICLIKLLARYSDPADEFHMDEHQVVQVCHQFNDDVKFMTVTTPHVLNNLARVDNCKFQIYRGEGAGAAGSQGSLAPSGRERRENSNT